MQIAELTDLFMEKKQSLNVKLPDCILCKAARSQMERAIQNIIVNAIRYSPDEAQIKVSVSAFHSTMHCEVENSSISSFHCAKIVYSHIDDCVIGVYNNAVRRNTNEIKRFD